MRMLINSPQTVVADALRGMAAAHPELDVDVERRVRARAAARRVRGVRDAVGRVSR